MNSESASNRNIMIPTNEDPAIFGKKFGPIESKVGDQGKCSEATIQCGTCELKSGS
jgi:hypothetical protein